MPLMFVRITRCIAATSTNKTLQAYQAKYAEKYVRVAERCSGASQCSLCGKLIRETEVLRIARGARTPTEAAAITSKA